MATTVQLRNKVLSRLGVKQQGQSVPAAYGATITEAYDSVYQALLKRNIAYWPKATIDDAALMWLSILVAYHVKDDFGASPAMSQELAATYKQAEHEIRKLSAETYVTDATEFSDF